MHCLLQSTPDQCSHTLLIISSLHLSPTYVSFKFILLHLQMKLTFKVLYFQHCVTASQQHRLNPRVTDSLFGD